MRARARGPDARGGVALEGGGGGLAGKDEVTLFGVQAAWEFIERGFAFPSGLGVVADEGSKNARVSCTKREITCDSGPDISLFVGVYVVEGGYTGVTDGFEEVGPFFGAVELQDGFGFANAFLSRPSEGIGSEGGERAAQGIAE